MYLRQYLFIYVRTSNTDMVTQKYLGSYKQIMNTMKLVSRNVKHEQWLLLYASIFQMDKIESQYYN
jgi:hypothetical protein